jgi:hypothetical protein
MDNIARVINIELGWLVNAKPFGFDNGKVFVDQQNLAFAPAIAKKNANRISNCKLAPVGCRRVESVKGFAFRP